MASVALMLVLGLAAGLMGGGPLEACDDGVQVAWQVSEVPSALQSRQVGCLDAAVTPDGMLHVAIPAGGQIHYLTLSGGDWQEPWNRTIAGGCPVVRVDQQGAVQVAIPSAGGVLVTRPGQGGWIDESYPIPYAYPDALALGPDGVPVVVKPGTYGVSLLVHRGGQALAEEVALPQANGGGDATTVEAVAVDSAGRVHLVFQRFGRYKLEYASDAGGQWSFEVLEPRWGRSTDTPDTAYGTAKMIPQRRVSLSVEGEGRAHVAYCRAPGFQTAHATNAEGAWKRTLLDPAVATGQNPLLRAGPNGKMHLLYLNASKGDLKYASDRAGTWARQTIDTQDTAGLASTLAVAPDGTLHAIYTRTGVKANHALMDAPLRHAVGIPCAGGASAGRKTR